MRWRSRRFCVHRNDLLFDTPPHPSPAATPSPRGEGFGAELLRTISAQDAEEGGRPDDLIVRIFSLYFNALQIPPHPCPRGRRGDEAGLHQRFVDAAEQNVPVLVGKLLMTRNRTPDALPRLCPLDRVADNGFQLVRGSLSGVAQIDFVVVSISNKKLIGVPPILTFQSSFLGAIWEALRHLPNIHPVTLFSRRGAG